MTRERPFNSHHSHWNRAWYTTSLEKTLRSHEGLIVPLYLDTHRELHANIDAPPKPNTQTILGALAMLDDLPQNIISNPPECIATLAEYYGSLRQNTATRLAKNLNRQLGYIEKGYYHAD